MMAGVVDFATASDEYLEAMKRKAVEGCKPECHCMNHAVVDLVNEVRRLRALQAARAAGEG